MAVLALTNEYISINSSEISDHVKSATIAVNAEDLDSSSMGDSWKEITSGLKAGTLTLELLDDFADSNIDDDLWQIFGTVVTFEVRPVNTTVGAGNPKYTGSVHINQAAFGGSHGQLAMKSLTFPTSGTVSRSES